MHSRFIRKKKKTLFSIIIRQVDFFSMMAALAQRSINLKLIHMLSLHPNKKKVNIIRDNCVLGEPTPPIKCKYKNKLIKPKQILLRISHIILSLLLPTLQIKRVKFGVPEFQVIHESNILRTSVLIKYTEKEDLLLLNDT